MFSLALDPTGTPRHGEIQRKGQKTVLFKGFGSTEERTSEFVITTRLSVCWCHPNKAGGGEPLARAPSLPEGAVCVCVCAFPSHKHAARSSRACSPSIMVCLFKSGAADKTARLIGTAWSCRNLLWRDHAAKNENLE